MADNQVIIELLLANNQYLARMAESAASTKKFSSSIEQSFKQLKKYLGFGTTLASVKMAFDKISEATKNAQSAQAQLNSVIASTGGAAGVTSEFAEKLAKKMEALTGVEDANIIRAEAILLRYTNIKKDAFEPATLATLNLAASGMELNQAAKLVGIGMENPINALTRWRRAGILFSGDQEKQIRQMVSMNNIAGAQKILVEALAKSYGGLAAAQSEKWGGSMARLSLIMDHTYETIGERMAPGLALFSKTLYDCTQNGQGLQRAIEAIGNLGGETFARLAVTTATFNLILTRAATGWERLTGAGGKGSEVWVKNQEEIAKADKLLDETLSKWDALSTAKEKKTPIFQQTGYNAPRDKEAEKEAEKAKKLMEKQVREWTHFGETVKNQLTEITKSSMDLINQMSENAINNIERQKKRWSEALDYMTQQQLVAAGVQDLSQSEQKEKELKDLQSQYAKAKTLTDKKNLKDQITAKEAELKNVKIKEAGAQQQNAINIWLEWQEVQMKRRSFERNKLYQLAMIWVNTSAAITAAWLAAWQMQSSGGVWQASVAMGAVSSALMLANGILQAAVILSQQAPSFAMGTNEITQSGFAMVHKDEMIAPAKYAQPFKEFMGGSEGGNTTIIVQGSIIDSKGLIKAVNSAGRKFGSMIGGSLYQFRSVYS